MKPKSEVKIFLAHANEDKALVIELYNKLKGSGYSPWLDKIDLMPGQQWKEEISRAIANSTIFIACLSDTSIKKRGYIQNEFRLALKQAGAIPAHEIYLIPLKFNECEVPELAQSDYGIRLRDFQWLNYWEEKAFERLIAALEYKRGLSEVVEQREGQTQIIEIIEQYSEAEQESSTPVFQESSALEIWQERLAFFQKEEAIASDAAKKFELSKRIEECFQQIRELTGEIKLEENPAHSTVKPQEETERANLRQYREQIREYLDKRYITDFENILLHQLAEDLSLTSQETERILAEEQAPILQAREAYRKRLHALINGGFYPFNEAIANALKQFKQGKNLTDWEVREISQPIFAEAEKNSQERLRQQRREEYENKLQRYEQEFNRVISARYPINRIMRNSLKELQGTLGLKNEEVESIERPILARQEAEHQRRIAEQREQARQQQLARERENAQRRRDTPIIEIPPISRRRLLQLGGTAAFVGVIAYLSKILPKPINETNKSSPKPINPVNEPSPKPIKQASKPNISQMSFEVVKVNRKGEITTKETKTAKYFQEAIAKGITLEMVAIPAGTFLMGSPKEEKYSSDDERPQHQVNISPFYMSQTPITQAQWKVIAALPQEGKTLKTEPSHFKGDDLPVEKVSWQDAIEFCARLSRHTGRNYRLPSEAEWEYVCRAGTTTPFHFGETLTYDLANYDARETYQEEPPGEYRGKTTPVKSFTPNAFGLYDMHGNVWEWCLDPWHENYNDAPNDGSVWDEINKNDNRYQNILDNINVLIQDKRLRVLRGGSWGINPWFCRSAYCFGNNPGLGDVSFGFRVVLVGPGL